MSKARCVAMRECESISDARPSTKSGVEQLSAAESLEHRGNPELPFRQFALFRALLTRFAEGFITVTRFVTEQV
jgi:hypothetical protein